MVLDDTGADQPQPSVPPAWVVPIWYQRAAAWAWRGLILLAGLYVLIRIVSVLRLVFLPVFIALLLTAFVAPIQRLLLAIGVPRLLATLVTFCGVVGVIAAASWLIGTSIGDQLLYEAQWDVVQRDVEEWLMDGPAALSAGEIDQLEERVRASLAGGAWAVGLDRVGLILQIVGSAVLTVALFFFFLKDRNTMWSSILKRVQLQRRESVDASGRAAFAALAGYSRGAAIAGIVDGAAIGLALYLLNVPLALPIAMLTFFAAFFPILGATLAGGVAVVVALVFKNPEAAIIVGVVVVAIQQVEGNVVVPMVMKRHAALHPAVVLVALAAGAAAAGIAGAFVAVPAVAAVSAGAGAMRADQQARTARSSVPGSTPVE